MGSKRSKNAKILARRRAKTAAGATSSIGMKVKKLQKIVPGGQGLKPDRLLLKTAEYILLLRLQINAFQILTKLCNIP
ncbi:uncharacterized protein [Henckelia pumila]|uniref:uncharacterized protein n=1 Tax=Henckelia pumila TaxID=405737 RepID=UPI003C6E4B9D